MNVNNLSLHGQLIAARSAYVTIHRLTKALESSMDAYRKLPGADLKSISAPEADLATVERELVLGKRENPVLSLALNGTRSVEDQYLELRKVNKGLRKFLPRSKDPEHNQRVQDMGDIIGNQRNLQSPGWYAFDNVVTGFAYAAPILWGLTKLFATYVIGDATPLPDASPEDVERILRVNDALTNEFPLYMGGLLGGGLMALGAQQSRWYPSKSVALAKAKYVDDTIKDVI